LVEELGSRASERRVQHIDPFAERISPHKSVLERVFDAAPRRREWRQQRQP
jgi:hypothetical protein